MKKLAIMFFVAMMMVVGGFSADAFDLQKGDIMVFGYPARGQDHPAYAAQMFLGYYQKLAQKCKLYEPVFGTLKTWDDSIVPMGERYFWGHIEVALEDNSNFQGLPKDDLVILRLTETGVVDKEAFVEAYESLDKSTVNIPFLGVLVTWIKTAVQEGWVDWMDGNTFREWGSLYGIDFENIPFPQKYQSYQTTDMDSSDFGRRSADCSTGVGWALMYAWEAKVPSVREFFQDHPERIASVDCLSPGQIPWFLTDKGLATIVAKLPALEGVE